MIIMIIIMNITMITMKLEPNTPIPSLKTMFSLLSEDYFLDHALKMSPKRQNITQRLASGD